jgi:hypothetical protein
LLKTMAQFRPTPSRPKLQISTIGRPCTMT